MGWDGMGWDGMGWDGMGSAMKNDVLDIYSAKRGLYPKIRLKPLSYLHRIHSHGRCRLNRRGHPHWVV